MNVDSRTSGTQITPEIETARRREEAPSASTTDKSSAVAERHTILLIDDEESVLKAVRRTLFDQNYHILTALSGSEALQVLAQNVVDLIICDYQMPGMLGTDLLKKVREKYPRTIRIMLTGVDDTRVVMEAIDGGAVYKFITKPWNDDDLKVTVSLALTQQELLRENTKLKKVARQQHEDIDRLARYAVADRSTLGSVLVNRGTLLPGQLEMVVEYCHKKNVILPKALSELGMVNENELIRVIQDESKADFAALEGLELNRELSRLLPREVCEAACLVPIDDDGSNLTLAMADPLDLSQIDRISFTTGRNITTKLAHLEEIEKAISLLYDEGENDSERSYGEVDFIGDGDDIDLELDDEEFISVDQLMAKSTAPTAVRMVNAIVGEAIRTGASDIHIEPKPSRTLVRYRIDGLLHGRIKIPADQHLPTVSRMKILAKMDIAERRVPQDGRISVRVGDRILDIRVSSMPTIHGEKIVCRLLDKTASVLSLEDIGISGSSLKRLRDIISVPQGMIIATGPTGSGKTTTLYSIMEERMSPSLNFVTIEDPVEYLLEPASQIYVRNKIGLTFASSLRSTLRQDPDVVLVGEIRDLDTARAAFQAAMTGHLVFTTLHTNSTIATISRLFNLGIEPYLVASAVEGIMAQRLVRRICMNCKTEREYDRDLWGRLGVRNDNLPDKLFWGAGCEKCGGTGYSGRIGLFEVFQMYEEFRQFLTVDYQESALLNMARSLGMANLLEDGVEKVVDGMTTIDELLRVLGPSPQYEQVCRNCDRKLDSKFLICPYCGTNQRSLCRHCRAHLESDWVVCPYCGSGHE